MLPILSILYFQYDQVIMLAAGTGIAPMLQLIRAALDNDYDDTRLTLLYSCKKASDILMKDQLDEFKAFWNFKVTYFLTQVYSLKPTSYLINQ